MQITASYAKKINHALYGGQAYENSDHFGSITIDVEDDADPKETHKEVAVLIKDMVDGRIEEEIMNMDGGLPATEFNRMLDLFLINKPWGGAEDYEKMSQYQKNIFQIIKRAKKRKVVKEHNAKD